jgi:hypothetical protein
MSAVPFAGVKRCLGGRQGENQPAAARVHGFESQNIPEKRAIRVGVFAVEHDMGAEDHRFFRPYS